MNHRPFAVMFVCAGMGLAPQALSQDAAQATAEQAPLSEQLALAATLPAEQAMAVYETVLASTDATADDKSVARARLAQLVRAQNHDMSDVRRTIDSADEDLRLGLYDAAQIKYEAVLESGVELGYYDQQRVASRLQVIAETTPQLVATQTEDAAAEEVVEETTEEVVEAEAEAELTRAQQRQLARLISQGDASMQAGDFNAAINSYQQAELIQPSAALTEKIGAAEEAANSALASVAENLERRRQIVLQRFSQSLASADSAVATEDYTAAQEFVEAAKAELEANRELFTNTDYQLFRAQADQKSEFIAVTEQVRQEQIIQDIEGIRLAELAAIREQARIEQAENIHQLLVRALELRREQNYDAALDRVEEALFLDPTHPAARLMRDQLQYDNILFQTVELERQQDYQQSRQSLEITEMLIPYADIIQYPANWPEKTQERLANASGNGLSEADRRTMRALETPVAQVNFEGFRLANVIAFLQEQTGANFDPNWNALDFSGIDQDTPITLRLQNVTAEVVLERVLRQISSDFERITYAIESGIIVISTERDLQEAVSLQVYDIRDLLVPNYDLFFDAPDFNLRNALRGSGGGGRGGSSGGGGNGLFGNDSDRGNRTEQRTFRRELIQDIVNLIEDTVGDPLEWVGTGGNSSSVNELRGRLLIRTTSNNHVEIRRLLQEFRAFRNVAIQVQARLLLVEENFFEQIGVDLDFQIDDPGGNFTPITFGQDSISLTGRRTTPLSPPEFAPNIEAGPQVVFVPGLGVSDSVNLGQTSGRSLDFNISYLDDIEVNLLVQATLANQRTTNLTAPNVTFVNGTSAYIVVAQELAFISDLDVVPNAAAFDPELDTISSGVVLAVEGAVTPDRRYVTLNIWPSLRDVARIRSIDFTGVSTVGTGDNQDSVIINGVIEAPETSVTQIRTQVSVPDEGTLLMGGQKLAGEVEVEAGIPVLSKIPVLNRLFTNNTNSSDERTLLVLVKPTIIIQDEEENERYPGLLDDPENYPG